MLNAAVSVFSNLGKIRVRSPAVCTSEPPGVWREIGPCDPTQARGAATVPIATAGSGPAGDSEADIAGLCVPKALSTGLLRR